MKSTRTGHRWAAVMVAAMLTTLVAAIAAPAQTYSVVYSFAGGTGGSSPWAGLIADGAGNLYGTTQRGGSYGFGTVFKLDPEGNETVLYSFAGGADGTVPQAGLIRDNAGNLYGDTANGGIFDGGTVFKLDSTGHETVLYAFAGRDGMYPEGSLTQDAVGNLYGTTERGGLAGLGVVFKLDTLGNETVLHSFNWTNGAGPFGGPIRDAVGDFYGIASGGGLHGYGVVFKLDPAGNESTLYNFPGGADGANPEAALIRDAVGNLYGTTAFGGVGVGVVFELDAADSETVLHSFKNNGLDGTNPAASLVRDATGNLYGTTANGGTENAGTVFAVGSDGSEKLLYSFSGGTDGAYPQAGLLPYEGALYGTTSAGGAGYGVIYKITLH
ncbi:MAG TPA: choice-of-anchor tandem repeat GloVer-containing protein [Terriglobia bacterium]|nr:choice-of-anchor tandem repeat GloVer-containing protein [Terriglobia bacterium]